MSLTTDVTRVAIAGLGTIGRVVARYLLENSDRMELAAVASGSTERAQDFLTSLGAPNIPVISTSQLVDHADIVVECAPPEFFREIAEPVLAAGKRLVTVNSGALLANWDLVDLAEQRGAQIDIPTGAFMGLDGVQSAAQGEIYSVKMVTRKPPESLENTPFVKRRNIDLASGPSAQMLFTGTIREAIKEFPSNLNIAVNLALAGVGPDQTHIEVWSDRAVERNTHTVRVDSDSATLEFTIANVISAADDSKVTQRQSHAGKITPLSIIAALKKLNSIPRVGT